MLKVPRSQRRAGWRSCVDRGGVEGERADRVWVEKRASRKGACMLRKKRKERGKGRPFRFKWRGGAGERVGMAPALWVALAVQWMAARMIVRMKSQGNERGREPGWLSTRGVGRPEKQRRFVGRVGLARQREPAIGMGIRAKAVAHQATGDEWYTTGGGEGGGDRTTARGLRLTRGTSGCRKSRRRRVTRRGGGGGAAPRGRRRRRCRRTRCSTQSRSSGRICAARTCVWR
eukprot:scaffold9052_cov107-Isochrysis_galbana.AAC.11